MEALCGYLDGWNDYFADLIQTGEDMLSDSYGDMYERGY